MQKLCSLFVCACAVTYVYAAARIYPSEPKPEEYACEEGCYLSHLDRLLPYNEPYYPPGKCEVYKCKINNMTEWYSCSVVAVWPGCRVVKDQRLQYPDCCPKTVCDPTTEATTTTEASTQDSTINEVPLTQVTAQDDFKTTEARTTSEATIRGAVFESVL